MHNELVYMGIPSYVSSLQNQFESLRKVFQSPVKRGLPGYLILFATHAFVPQRQNEPSKSPSPPVFFLISTHFTATLKIPLASTLLKLYSFRCLQRLSLCLLHLTCIAACEPFTPSDSGQR